jgi:hypothetical protein
LTKATVSTNECVVVGALKGIGLDGLSMDLDGLDLPDGTDLGDDRLDSEEWNSHWRKDVNPTFLELRCSVGDSICDADLFRAGLEETMTTFADVQTLGSEERKFSASSRPSSTSPTRPSRPAI